MSQPHQVRSAKRRRVLMLVYGIVMLTLGISCAACVYLKSEENKKQQLENDKVRFEEIKTRMKEIGRQVTKTPPDKMETEPLVIEWTPELREEYRLLLEERKEITSRHPDWQ